MHKKAAGAIRFGLGRVPRMVVESMRADERVVSVEGEDLREAASTSFGAAWIGHAGLLLRQGATTILADPVLSHRIGPRVLGRVIGPSRMLSPGVTPELLPRIDLVLVTHAHYDHLDRATLEMLANPRTVVVTARRTGRLVPRGYAGVVELDWDECAELAGVGVRAIRPVHWGGRRAIDVARGFNSYLLEGGGRRALVAGDTARTNAYAGLGAIDLAAFGIGAYEPSDHHHATPEQVWGMFTQMPGRWLLPVHHSTFELSRERVEEPMRRLLGAAGEEAGRVLRVRPGELWTP